MSELPIGWALRPLSAVSNSISNGFTYSNAPQSGGLPISRIQTISHGEIDFEAVGYAGLSAESMSKHLLQPGDILFSHINSKEHVGKVAIYKTGMTPLLHGMNLLRIVANELVLPEFLFWAIRSDAVKSQIFASTRHAVNQASINIRNLQTVLVPVPPIDEQKRIVATLEVHLDRLDKALGELKLTSQKRAHFQHSLLHSLFEGVAGEVAPLGQVVKPKYGKDVPKHLRGDGFDVPVVGSAGVMTYTQEALVTKPSVLVGRKGNVGAVQKFEGPCSPVDTAYYLVCPEDIDLDYLYYQLLAKDLKSLDSSTAIPSLRREDLEAVEFVKPSLSEQIAIAERAASLLSSVEQGLETIEASMKQLGLLRRSLLSKAFTGGLVE